MHYVSSLLLRRAQGGAWLAPARLSQTPGRPWQRSRAQQGSVVTEWCHQRTLAAGQYLWACCCSVMRCGTRNYWASALCQQGVTSWMRCLEDIQHSGEFQKYLPESHWTLCTSEYRWLTSCSCSMWTSEGHYCWLIKDKPFSAQWFNLWQTGVFSASV